MKEIFIFDIDGCVLPQVFPNIYKNNAPNEDFMNEALKKGEGVSLFEDFVKFYEKHCKNAHHVFFMTGRQKRYFGEITEKQLFPLKKIKEFDIIYYPEEKSHDAEEYFNWKIESLEEIFKKQQKALASNLNGRNALMFRIFDDMDEYFPAIKALSKQYAYTTVLTSIKGSKTWTLLLD